MLVELLVLYTCSQDIGCQPTVNAYYEYNQSVKTSVQNLESLLIKNTPKPVEKYVFPIVAVMYFNRDFVVPLHKHFYFETNKNFNFSRMRYTYEF
jgi:hypothetical protein